MFPAVCVAVDWQTTLPGVEIGSYWLRSGGSSGSEVILVRLTPRQVQIAVARELRAGEQAADIQTLTRRAGGLGGINTNFFDHDLKPLGLIIDGGKIVNRLHKGGNVLSGVLIIRPDSIQIVHRSAAESMDVSRSSIVTAVQAGPRLIVNGKRTALAEQQYGSRRSGAAVTRSGALILYVTRFRFPGATLQEIQNMLLDTELDVQDALNFDGGGSSQLFIEKHGMLNDELFVTGGDLIPVGLIFKSK
jgi:uncharacterized protein YigE (DUF2233 family)